VARIRFIKPEFFDDPDIGVLSPAAALFFIGLWTQADKAGRMIDDARRLKVRLLAYWPVTAESLLDELANAKFILRYQDAEGRKLLQIRSFAKHQRPHPKEAASELPGPVVEKHGQQGKNTASMGKESASKLDSGVLILDSGSLDSGVLDSGSLDSGVGGLGENGADPERASRVLREEKNIPNPNPKPLTPLEEKAIIDRMRARGAIRSRTPHASFEPIGVIAAKAVK